MMCCHCDEARVEFGGCDVALRDGALERRDLLILRLQLRVPVLEEREVVVEVRAQGFESRLGGLELCAHLILGVRRGRVRIDSSPQRASCPPPPSMRRRPPSAAWLRHHPASHRRHSAPPTREPARRLCPVVVASTRMAGPTHPRACSATTIRPSWAYRSRTRSPRSPRRGAVGVPRVPPAASSCSSSPSRRRGAPPRARGE